MHTHTLACTIISPLCLQLIGNLVLGLGLVVAAVTGIALYSLLQLGPGMLD